MKCKLILIIILFFNSSGLISAQDKKDSTRENWSSEKWYDWDKSDWLRWEFHGRPFIEVNYGFGVAEHKKLVSSIADVGLLELKLGYASRSSFLEEDIFKFKEKYVFGTRINSSLISNSLNINEMRSGMWRFGFANRKGYAYMFDQFSILPYNGGGFVWSRLDMEDYPAKFYLLTKPPMSLDDAISDTDILNRFHQAFRFGTFNEGGIRFEIATTFSVNIGYEAVVIFPRYMFWKHLGSMLIEEGAKGLLNGFIEEVSDSSPYATPIVDFLLKNGFSYAFFTLKKDRMNWPFETESPLTYEMLKFGVTFTF